MVLRDRTGLCQVTMPDPGQGTVTDGASRLTETVKELSLESVLVVQGTVRFGNDFLKPCRFL